MSDIHGCYSALQEMLEKIEFDPKKDELIIAGDIVDRGLENREMLEYAASKPEGVTFLMGNHDQDFIFYCEQMDMLYSTHRIPQNVDLYELVTEDELLTLYERYVYDHYGTVRNMIVGGKRQGKPLTMNDFRKWAKCISAFPYTLRREAGDRKYIIVHAGYISEEEYRERKKNGDITDNMSIQEFYLWAREEGMLFGEKGATVIFGHTPTIISDREFYTGGKVFIREKDEKRFINIDCGCVFRRVEPSARLACIRLGDEEIFYL